MNQPELKRSSLAHDGCSELLSLAQRELAAFFRAVTELFGIEEAQLSAEDWLHEVEARRSLPASAREWRQLTLKVMAQLANRGLAVAIPNLQLQPAGY